MIVRERLLEWKHGPGDRTQFNVLSAEEGNGYPLQYCWASLGAQTVKNLPAMQETWVWSLGQEDTLEKGMASHSSIVAWKIPWTKEPSGLQPMGSRKCQTCSVQLPSLVQLFVTPWTATCQASLSITKSWSLFKLMSIELVMPSNHLILCCPLPRRLLAILKYLRVAGGNFNELKFSFGR